MKSRLKTDYIDKERTFFIAEAGVNHNGNVQLAKELICAAKLAGADAVKFQTFKADRVISKFASKAQYQKNKSRDTESQLDMLRKLELRDEDYFDLVNYSKEQDILFLSTPKDIKSAKFLEKINMEIFKVGSSEINNLSFLEYLSGIKKPLILSTGMCTIDEVSEAVSTVNKDCENELYLLHCVSQYPSPIDQINLRSIITMREKYGLDVGYSDHTIGNEAVLAAVSLGARIIEKHFTLDKNLEGPDHKVSMDVHETRNLISSIRKVESAMGDGKKKPAECEKENILLLRRSLVFTKSLITGTSIEDSHLTIKRPGNGIEPKYMKKLLGKKLNKNVHEDEPVTWDIIE